MDTIEIKRIIQEQEQEKEEILKKERIIERDLDTKRIRSFLRFPNVVVILGPRRCGKTVLSWLLAGNKRYGYINFDDEALYGIKSSDLNTILKAFYEIYGDMDFLIFDEIQNAPAWELFINRLRRTKKVIITGSNSTLLSSELATHLTGRHIDITLFPFSFREFCDYKNISIPSMKNWYATKAGSAMQSALQEYLEKGGLPESYKYGTPILKSIFGDIVTKDIIRRHRIRNISVIESLGKYLISNYSSEITFNKLRGLFSIKKIETIKNYVTYFQDAYLIFVLERFSFKLKQQFIAPKKIYCMDTGIINAISFKTSENIGRIFENCVCIELLRRKSTRLEDEEIFYWKNAQQEEVDFIVKKALKIIQLIQVCYDPDEQNTKKREVKALLKASKELKCSNMIVITRDYEAEEKAKGKKINFIPLWKWLIEG